MSQWEIAIDQFTDFKVFKVNKVQDLNDLFRLMENPDQLNKYDIILVKNGTVNQSYQLPRGMEVFERNKKPKRNQTSHIYNLIANAYKICWARVVVDDFDTIGLPIDAGVVPGLFTWFVSSTRKFKQPKKVKAESGSVEAYLRTATFGCGNIMKNNTLFRTLAVAACPRFIEATTTMPFPRYHIVTVKNRDA